MFSKLRDMLVALRATLRGELHLSEKPFSKMKLCLVGLFHKIQRTSKFAWGKINQGKDI